MDQTQTSPSAKDIGERVLTLVQHVRSPADIAPERIEALTGIKVEFNPGDANEYGFSGQLTDAWAYNLVSLPESDGSKPTRIMFSFDDETRDNADMAPVAALNFDDYAATLRAAGYAASPARGKHDQILYWDFSRDDVSVQIYVRGENDANAGHACVSKLIISA